MKTCTQEFQQGGILSRLYDRTPVNCYTRQAGLTLVETMIALTLSLLLLAGVLKIFIGNKQTYKVQDAMARLQENGRFALSFLTEEIRMAGFMGCQNVASMSVTNNVLASAFSNPAAVTAAVASFNGTNAVNGYSYGAAGSTVPTALAAMGITTGSTPPTGDIEPNTDAIFIRRAFTCPGADVQSSQSAGGTAQLTIADNTTCNIQQADIVMVTNCKTADIFGVSNVVNTGGNGANIAHGSNWNLAPMLAGGYNAGSFLLKMKSEVYYIGVGASGEPSLFRREIKLGAVVSQELVEGIEGMSILYGEDLDSDQNADTYVPAGSVTNMNNVVSVRVSVRARTLIDNVATSTDPTYNDKRIRRNFTTTIGIRNRMS